MNKQAFGQLNAPPEPAWYRQFWPWFLIAFPLTAVIAGFYTMYLAIISNDGLVADDYYKQGLAINTDLGRYQRASELGLWADVELRPIAADPSEAATNPATGEPVELIVHLHSSKVDSVPQLAMRLALVHPTQPNRDQKVDLLPAADGIYRARLIMPGKGYWHVNLESAGGEWRITGRALLADLPKLTLRSE